MQNVKEFPLVYVFNLRSRKEISTHEKRDILVQMNTTKEIHTALAM
jgi:hypothetical protein